ncbi:MAG: hypothetical protein ABSE63_04985 [Thermoguttaceae bacterium]|jgi:hypothetical protein
MECGKKEVWPAVVSHNSEIRHDGRLITVVVPQLRVPRCQACGGLVFDNDADEQIEKAFHEVVYPGHSNEASSSAT